MSQETQSKDEKSFMYLVGTFQSSTWIALGKIENPMTNKTEQNLKQARFYIDLLEMMQTKTKGNLTEYEEQMLINTVSELNMNFIEEKRNSNSTSDGNENSLIENSDLVSEDNKKVAE